jgi:hypothetical protein
MIDPNTVFDFAGLVHEAHVRTPEAFTALTGLPLARQTTDRATWRLAPEAVAHPFVAAVELRVAAARVLIQIDTHATEHIQTTDVVARFGRPPLFYPPPPTQRSGQVVAYGYKNDTAELIFGFTVLTLNPIAVGGLVRITAHIRDAAT